jgi:hypothetical protein
VAAPHSDALLQASRQQSEHVILNCCVKLLYQIYIQILSPVFPIIAVPDPGKGVCADPVNGDAILGKGGPDPQGGNKERQLSPDKGRDKT